MYLQRCLYRGRSSNHGFTRNNHTRRKSTYWFGDPVRTSSGSLLENVEYIQKKIIK